MPSDSRGVGGRCVRSVRTFPAREFGCFMPDLDLEWFAWKPALLLVLKGNLRRRLRYVNLAGAQHGAGDRSETLDVEVHDRERVLLNELAARFDLVTHERGEDVVCGHCVLDPHLHQP